MRVCAGESFASAGAKYSFAQRYALCYNAVWNIPVWGGTCCAMEKSEKKRLITLLGTPLSGSFAPQMHNAAYRAMGLDLHYFCTETDEAALGDALRTIRNGDFAGFAVTKPLKVAILPYLDALDPLCRAIGACNTVVRKSDGKLVGYNTDAAGFSRALAEGGFDARGASIFCIGAGGAGRAICFALSGCGAARIFITDVIHARAAALACEINEHAARDAAVAVETGDLTALEACGAVINASGVGMGETEGRSPLPSPKLLRGQFCFDACYNPAKTRFLQDAAAVGCRTMNGLSMSLYQGAAQIVLWTGREPPINVMRRAIGMN